MPPPDLIASRQPHPLQGATTRVALAAYLHDLGKFAERAGVFSNDPRLAAHLTLYSPFHTTDKTGRNGWHSHRHAAHTALAFDVIEPFLPPLLAQDGAPFVSRRHASQPAAEGTQDATDSLINAAAAHHLPQTFLQWVIATADRVASGFEREAFEQYNAAWDKQQNGLDHITSRQLTLFEQIRLDAQRPAPAETALQWRYPLKPLAPAHLFPQKASQCESRERASAQAEYAELWHWFLQGLKQIPASHRQALPLWLDHFDSLWLAATQAIPAATAFGTKPEVSLYDHSRTTAALAAALWRWHDEAGQCDAAAARRLKERADFAERKFLLVQGDFFGIQDFIFASGGQTRRHAAKLLRGRSFQVSLFTEVAALRVLDALGLPPTSQVMNAAGKFMIVAPNTATCRVVLEGLRAELDDWFLTHTFGQAGVGLAWEPASCADFLTRTGTGAAAAPCGFAALLTRLRNRLEQAKHQRFDLCRHGARVFTDADFGHGPCDYNGRLPADRAQTATRKASCALSRDQIAIGESLVRRHERLLIAREDSTEPLHELRDGAGLRLLELPLLGYRIAFTQAQEASGRFGVLAQRGVLRRCFDFAAASADDTQGTTPLWAGYARRFISGYVPQASGWEPEEAGRYLNVAEEDLPRVPGELLHLDVLACLDRQPARPGDDAPRWQGVAALGVLKGDIDNLGDIFRSGLERPSFAKQAALSRQVNSFFAIYLPWLLVREFPGVYTVFAGGDDFFLIGPWRTVQKLAARMREEFGRYVAGNPGIHFSAGIVTQKPGAPIPVLAELAEDALGQAKQHGPQGRPALKNAVTCFGQTVGWAEWPALEQALARLNALREEMNLSTGYVYGLLAFTDMRAEEAQGQPEAAMWRSRFKYRTRRFVVDKLRNLDEPERQRRFTALLDIYQGIERLGPRYRVALFNHLYQFRDR